MLIYLVLRGYSSLTIVFLDWVCVTVAKIPGLKNETKIFRDSRARKNFVIDQVQLNFQWFKIVRS